MGGVAVRGDFRAAVSRDECSQDGAKARPRFWKSGRTGLFFSAYEEQRESAGP